MYKPIYNILSQVLEAAGDSVIEFYNIPINVLAVLADIVFQMFDHMDGVCAYLDSYVQLAKVEAAYENTRWIMKELACQPSSLKRGHGCDGIDNNCDNDGNVDECAEDVIDPEIDLSAVYESCGNKVFQSTGEASSCVESFMKVTDDCQVINPSTDITVSSNTNDVTCESEIGVQVLEQTCQQSANASLTLKVDSEAPELRCSIDKDVLINEGIDSYEDIGFSYTVIDNCDAEVNVKIEVFSNEVDLAAGAVLIADEGDSIYVRNHACAQEE